MSKDVILGEGGSKQIVSDTPETVTSPPAPTETVTRVSPALTVKLTRRTSNKSKLLLVTVNKDTVVVVDGVTLP
jgi:hypothetical protein